MLGGLLDFAHTVKGPHENLMDLKDYLIRQMELAGVKVETGVEVTADTIAEAAPDAAIDFDQQKSRHAMRMMTTALYALGGNDAGRAA